MEDIQPWPVIYMCEMISNFLVKHMEAWWNILIIHPIQGHATHKNHQTGAIEELTRGSTVWEKAS